MLHFDLFKLSPSPKSKQYRCCLFNRSVGIIHAREVIDGCSLATSLRIWGGEDATVGVGGDCDKNQKSREL